MIASELDILPPVIPEGTCIPDGPNWLQEVANMILLGAKLVVPNGVNGFVRSQSEPELEERDKLWLKTDPNGDVTGMFYFSLQYSKWVWPIGATYSTQERRIFRVTNESEIWGLDGGDGTNPQTTAPTATTGAVWQADHDFDGAFPLGAGNLNGSPVAPNSTGGSATTVIAKENLPAEGVTLPDKVIGQPGPGKGSFSLNGDNNPPDDFKYVPKTDNLGEAKPLNVVNPYLAVLFAKRTARQFYTP